eukprot:CAMPEP_0175335732 /NCGR_PEP_ID=MMETSP0095-20121207/3445_1 /TAXON_ID=311494 /ORGANISM="Alexandrium monilatum, Strain CCMP3105" /LENGTH=540 /DNA_ID=CAMNT_0016633061 /DNA_START=1 /DNA_END=1623 /DNA_ORIENTATION=-
MEGRLPGALAPEHPAAGQEPSGSAVAVEPASSSWRPRSMRWVCSDQASALLAGCILVNAAVLGVEADHRPNVADPLSQPGWFAADSAFTAVYLIECFLRMEAERALWCCDPWNVFDALLVLISVADVWLVAFTGVDSDMWKLGVVRIFRLLRLTRVLYIIRLFRFVKELWLILNAIVRAIGAMAWSLLLIGAVLLISAIFTTRLVGQDCCSTQDAFTAAHYAQWFGTVPRSLFTLFQFATLENWPYIARDAFGESPALVLFIMVFIMLTHIMLLNTVSGIVVENVLSVAQTEEEGRAQAGRDLQRKKLRKLFDCMDTNEDGSLEWDELQQRAKWPSSPRLTHFPSTMAKFAAQACPEVESDRTMLDVTLQHAKMTEVDAKELFRMLDADGSGAISKEEFVESVMLASVPPTAMNLLQLSSSINRTGSRLKSVALRLRTLDGALHGLCKSLPSGQGLGGLGGKMMPVIVPLGAPPPDAAASDLGELRRDMLEALSGFEERLATEMERGRPNARPCPRAGRESRVRSPKAVDTVNSNPKLHL